MKHVQIFGIVLLVAIISFAVAAFACDNLKSIRDTANTAFETAESEFQKVSLEVAVLSGLIPTVVTPIELPKPPPSNEPWSPPPPPPDPPPDPPKVPISTIIKNLANPVLTAKYNAAKQKRDKAKLALDSAQFQLDQCLTPEKEKAACGHDMPGYVAHCSTTTTPATACGLSCEQLDKLRWNIVTCNHLRCGSYVLHVQSVSGLVSQGS